MQTDNTTPSSPDQLKWDRRYEGATAPGRPVRVLAEYAHLLPHKGRALDLACGLGANALLLADHGLEVSAWDLSPVAIALLNGFSNKLGLRVRTEVHDLKPEHLPPNQFDVIVVSHFLERTLCPAIRAALRPCGLLYYQTFTREHIGPQGPRNTDYLLAPNELLALFSDLQIVFYREDGTPGDAATGQRGDAMLVGLNTSKNGHIMCQAKPGVLP